MARRDKRLAWALSGLALATAICVYVMKSDDSAKESKGTRGTSNRNIKNLALVISSTNVSLEPILEQYPNMVVLVLNAEQKPLVPEKELYRVISCDTVKGVIHVLKHLRSEQVFVPEDLYEIRHDLVNFVKEVVALEHIEHLKL